MQHEPEDYSIHECNHCYEEIHDDELQSMEIFTHNYKYEFEGEVSIGEEIICGYCITDGILDTDFDYSYEYLNVKPMVRYVRPFEVASGFAIWLAVYHGQLDPSNIHPECLPSYRKVRDRIEETFPEMEIRYLQ
jgi:hypothetical protein